MLWKSPAAWFSVNAFYAPGSDGHRLRNWYPNSAGHAYLT